MYRFLLSAVVIVMTAGTALAQTGQVSSDSSSEVSSERGGAADSSAKSSAESNITSSEAVSSVASSEAPTSSAVSSTARPLSSSTAMRSSERSSVSSMSPGSSIASSARLSSIERSSVVASAMSSSAVSSSAPSSASSVQTASGWLTRERLGYSVPIIDPDAIMHPSEISLDARAIGGNLLLALLFAVVLGISGLFLGHLQITNERRLRQVLGRLPLQILFTMLLIWLGNMLVPDASAQGFGAADSSISRIPLYAILLFIVIGISNTFFNAFLLAQGEKFRAMTASSSDKTLGRRWWFIALLILLYGIIGGYINPDFNLLPNKETGIIVVTTITVILSAYAKDLFSYFLAGKWRYPRWFQANLAGLAIAIGCVALSRTLALNPGYIYGIPVGLLIGTTLNRRGAGLFDFLGLLWVMAVALLVWVLGSYVMPYPVPSDLFNVLYVVLVEAAFIELLPLPYFAGGAIFRWNKILWFLQFVAVTFLLFHTLFHPQGTIVSIDQSPPAFTALLLLACYVVGIVVVWACVVWVRRR